MSDTERNGDTDRKQSRLGVANTGCGCAARDTVSSVIAGRELKCLAYLKPTSALSEAKVQAEDFNYRHVDVVPGGGAVQKLHDGYQRYKHQILMWATSFEVPLPTQRRAGLLHTRRHSQARPSPARDLGSRISDRPPASGATRSSAFMKRSVSWGTKVGTAAANFCFAFTDDGPTP